MLGKVCFLPWKSSNTPFLYKGFPCVFIIAFLGIPFKLVNFGGIFLLNENLKQILMEIAFLENRISGIPLPADDCSIDSLVIDCLNSYLFYLRGVAISKGLL